MTLIFFLNLECSLTSADEDPADGEVHDEDGTDNSKEETTQNTQKVFF